MTTEQKTASQFPNDDVRLDRETQELDAWVAERSHCVDCGALRLKSELESGLCGDCVQYCDHCGEATAEVRCVGRDYLCPKCARDA